MAGLAEEETFDEKDKGPLVYQESKVFHTEYFLCSAYDNSKDKLVTFEIYGLDTQDMFHIGYSYADFDQLFRFNAELMNPNRKEGRFHWIFERLAIVTVGKERKLQLKPEPSEEVPELPVYETTRKIPTGRMDLKERQRLREQMDMLDIKRSENITKRRARTKERFLQHIFMLKEEDKKRKIEVDKKIERERKTRWKQKEELEKSDREKAIRLAELKKVRIKHVEVKEERSEENDEEEYRQLRARWKVKDAEKADAIREARQKKEAQMVQRLEDAQKERIHTAEVQERREVVFEARTARVKANEAKVLEKVLAVKAERTRIAKLMKERNQEFIEICHQERQPIFQAQLQRTQQRQEFKEAESEATATWEEKRSIPKKVKTKGKHSANGGRKAPKEDGDKKSADVKNTEEVLDSVEMKMRAQMEDQKRRDKLERMRTAKLAENEKERRMREVEHMKGVKQAWREKQTEEESKAKERLIVRAQREEEMKAAKLRTQSEKERLDRVRQLNLERKEQQRLNKASTA